MPNVVRRPRVAVALIAAVTLLAPVAATAADLDQVVRERRGLENDLNAATERLEQLKGAIVSLEDELAHLDQQERLLRRQLRGSQAAVQDRARRAFKRGGELSTFAALLSADGPAEAVDRAGTLEALNSRDAASIEEARALRTQLGQLRSLQEARREELDQARDEAAEVTAALGSRLNQVRALEDDIRERVARQQQISRGAQQGIYACIFERPYSFVDSWGFPRSGGRSHKGTDVMASMGQPVYAFTHGRISRLNNSGLGGISVYLWGDDGVEYFYTHLQGYAPGIGVGTRVEAGQHIAYNGATGNARGGAPHVHFEVHPGGGSPVNPYPWLIAVC